MSNRPMLLTVITVLLALSAGAEQATGLVFHDLNGNGIHDHGEPGVAGVSVSNGEDVALTDKDGRYTLPMNALGVVFVVKPSGWAVPVHPETQIQQGHYIHRPEGSPPLKFGGVPPTGPLPEQINFPLRPQDEPIDFRFLCLGDTQPRDAREVGYLAQDLVAETMGIEAAFGITLGDLVFDDLSVFEPVARAIGMNGLPWHHVPGNHDMDFDAPTWQQTFESYQRVFGPPYYAFAHANAHVFVLNNIRWNVDTREYHAELGEQQRTFVRNYLNHVPKDHLLIFTMHIPVMNLRDRDAFFALFADYPHTLSLSAHWHRHQHYFLGEADGWPGDDAHHHIVHGTAGGSWYRGHYDHIGIPMAVQADGTPKGYSLFTISENTYDMVYKATRRPAEYQMDIHGPASASMNALSDTEIVVNFFNGSERCRVEMRLNDGPWTMLEQFTGKAPFYLELYERQETFLQVVAGIQGIEEADDQTLRALENLLRPVMGRGMPGPADTNHLWRAQLAGEGHMGYNVIEVRATDMFGRTHESRRLMYITP